MITTAVPVKLNPGNLYGPEEFQEGINIAIQNGIVYVVVLTFGSVMVHQTQMAQEDV